MNVNSEKQLSRDELLKGAGVWSMIGLLIILLVATLVGGASYSDLLSSFGGFLTGHLSSIPSGSEESLLAAVLNLAAIIFMTIIAASLTSMIVNRNVRSFVTEELDRILEKGPWVLFAVVFVEEAFTRWLFLGVIAKTIGGAPAFYACFVVGNALWALIHMGNFSNKQERSPIRVIPQFIGGLALTYVFVRYGFWVTLMTHYLYNLIVIATRKKQQPGKLDLYRLGYYLVVAAVSWALVTASGLSIETIAPWLMGQLVPLDSLSFWQYAVLLILLGTIVDIIAELLLLDVVKGNEDTLGVMFSPIGLALVVILFTVMIVGGNWLLAFVIDNPLTRALTLTVVMSLISSAKSGSAIARTTLVNLPSVYFTVVAFSVLGFWWSCGLATILSLVSYVPTILNILRED